MKKTNEIQGNKIFDGILNHASKEEKAFVTKSFHISSQILDVLESKKMLQKDFADKIGKSEAEISKWLSGFHNFTIKTIVNIETALEETIIITPQQIITTTAKEIEALISRINALDTSDSKTIAGTKPPIPPIAKVLDITKRTQPIQNEEPYLPIGA